MEALLEMKWCLIHVYPFKHLYGRRNNAFCDYEHCKELYISFTEMHKDTQGSSPFVCLCPSHPLQFISLNSKLSFTEFPLCAMYCVPHRSSYFLSTKYVFLPFMRLRYTYSSVKPFFFRLCLKFRKLRTLVLESSFHSDGRVGHKTQKTPVLFILIEGQGFITSHGCSFLKMGVILQPFCIFSKGQRKNKWT